jgi:hypothetical protein
VAIHPSSLTAQEKRRGGRTIRLRILTDLTLISVTTTHTDWGRFCHQIEQFLKSDTVDLVIDGHSVHGFRSPDSPALWIRDHSDMLRGGRYLDEDTRSAIEAFADSQAASGRIYDFVITRAENDTTSRENWEKWVRVPVEADVEYRFVKAVFLAWQSNGDKQWLSGLLPVCERALAYCMTHPWRWDAGNGLIKRPYTIDTWDFDYTAGRSQWLNFQITDHTFWGIAHSDNSGFFEAATLLARMYLAVGELEAGDRWAYVAVGIRDRANELLFNGRFYTHFHKLTPVTIDGVDEAEQLSLSNPMAINRGLATRDIAAAIIEEYRRRAASGQAFAPWFSIDPPFPDGIFGDAKLVGGAYINGGIFPLAGGELARAAFEHGFEAYGYETLRQYRRMIEETGETYLWYFPDGSPSTVETSTSPDAMPTDGWGSTAMLYAFLEGLCGIVDEDHSFRRVRLSPRWAATDETTASVRLSYASSGAEFAYSYDANAEGKLVVVIESESCDVSAHVLLPPGAHATGVVWNGQSTEFDHVTVRESRYVDFSGRVDARAEVEVRYASN